MISQAPVVVSAGNTNPLDQGLLAAAHDQVNRRHCRVAGLARSQAAAEALEGACILTGDRLNEAMQRRELSANNRRRLVTVAVE
jgi:gamma-glutamyl:cysteine ligase YbdK (ATP-grasp superfamily)